MEMNRQKKKMQPPSSIPADRNFRFFQYQTNQTFSFSANCWFITCVSLKCSTSLCLSTHIPMHFSKHCVWNFIEENSLFCFTFLVPEWKNINSLYTCRSNQITQTETHSWKWIKTQKLFLMEREEKQMGSERRRTMNESYEIPNIEMKIKMKSILKNLFCVSMKKNDQQQTIDDG